jgi:hypothetical protein
MDRNLLVNAFTPAAGIDDPHRFAGRRTEVEELTDALHALGSVPLIFGERGLGKSSLALQMSRIAQGDVELLSELRLDEAALTGDNRFIVLFVSCTDDTKDSEGLMQLLINAVDSMKDHLARDYCPGEHSLVDKQTKRTLSLKVFSTETTRTYDAAKKELDTSAFSRQERVLRLAELLTDTYQQPVLFIVDEFDRLGDSSGVASFFKSHSSAYLKFALIGIGDTEGALLSDHESLGRQLIPVPVMPMAPPELASIFHRTQNYLTDRGIDLEFTEEASARAASIASGFPWFVHLLGQVALLDVVKRGSTIVNGSDIDLAVRNLPQRRLAKQFNDKYNIAVRDSQSREVVLRLFAEWRNEDVPTSEIYSKAAALGITGPSVYTSHLTKHPYGAVLKPSPRQGRVYRFTDGMFKAYVRMRTSVYVDVDKNVRATFGR